MKKKYTTPQSKAIKANSQSILAASQEGITIGNGGGRPAGAPSISSIILDDVDDNIYATSPEE